MWPAGGTRAFRGPLGPPFSSQRRVQRAVGSGPLQAGGSVCVRVCVSAVCAVDKTVYLPGGARALPAPLGSFLSGKWDAGVTSAQPSCPCCRGLAGGGLPAAGGEGLAVCPGRLHLHSVSRSAGGGRGWALEAGAEVGGPSDPSVTGKNGHATCPRFPVSAAEQSRSRGSCPLPVWAAAHREHLSVWVAEGAGLPGPTPASEGLDSAFSGSSFTLHV